MIVAIGEGWQPGVIAIVAWSSGSIGRSLRSAGAATSARAPVRTVDMGAMVVAARLCGLLADAGS